jgi:hypothetical protein
MDHQPASGSGPHPELVSQPVDPDFGPLVRRAVLVSLIGWVTKVTAMIMVARDLNGEIHIRRWGPGIPYLAFNVPRNEFTVITSKSSVALAFVMLVLLVAGILRNRSKIHVAGWCFAMVVTGYSIAIDLLLQRWVGNYTDLKRLRWGVGTFSLMSLLVAWWIAIEHPHSRLVRWRSGLAAGSSDPNLALGEIVE